MGAGGEPKVGLSIYLNRKVVIVCSLKCTDNHSSPAWPGMVADNSLIQSVALLVCPRGTTRSMVDCHEFTGS